MNKPIFSPDSTIIPVQKPQTDVRGKSPIYYGWLILPIAVATGIATSPGQTYGIAMFNPHIGSALQLSETQLAGAYMAGTLLASLPLGWIGRMMDRHGLRTMLFITIMMLGIACCVAALAQGIVTVFFAYFLLRMLGPGALSLLSSSTLAFWFDRRLGTVEGIRNLGMAGAVAVVPAFHLYLIRAFGWREAFALLGVIVCAVMLPLLAFVFRNRPEDVGQTIEAAKPARSGTQTRLPAMTIDAAMRVPAFWIVLGLTAFWGMVSTALTFHIIPVAVSHGLQATDAAWLITIFAAALAGTNLVAGVLADRIALRWLLAASGVCLTTSMLLLNRLGEPGMVNVCGALLGMAQGLSSGIAPVLCVRYFGRVSLGQIRGIYSTAMIAASSLGPFVLGLGHDLLGSYDGIFLGFAVASMLAFVATLFAWPPHNDPKA